MNINQLTDAQSKVLDLIKQRTKENPITGAELTKTLVIYDDIAKKGANMRSIINTLRDKNYPICANSNGYFYPQSKFDLEMYILEFRNRIKEQESACDSLTVALHNWDHEHFKATENNIDELIKGFRPQFGNASHLDLPRLMKKRQELKQKADNKNNQVELQTLEAKIIKILKS